MMQPRNAILTAEDIRDMSAIDFFKSITEDDWEELKATDSHLAGFIRAIRRAEIVRSTIEQSDE